MPDSEDSNNIFSEEILCSVDWSRERSQNSFAVVEVISLHMIQIEGKMLNISILITWTNHVYWWSCYRYNSTWKGFYSIADGPYMYHQMISGGDF